MDTGSRRLRRNWLGALLLQFAAFAGGQTPTPILIDINTGNGPVIGSDPGQDIFVRLTATQTVFDAFDPVHGRELWITDGTVGGTHLLADICPGACSSSPRPLNSANAVALGVLYFSADDGAHGTELWKVTSAGVVSFVKDINPGALGSSPTGPMAFLSSAPTVGYFAATSAATGTEFWKTDGTAAGTVLVKDINTGPSSSSPRGFAVGLNDIYFSASEPNAGNEIYISNGTTGGTVLRADINSGPGDSAPGDFISFANDTMLFSADDGINGRELWTTTPTTTTLLKDIVLGSSGSFPNRFFGFSGRVFFVASGASGFGDTELWSSDDTPGGTAQFKDICAGSCGSNPLGMIVITTSGGPRLLFFATAGSSYSLYVSDGTSPGTVPLLGPVVANQLTVSGALAYFYDVESLKLYRTDGTAAGTILVRDFGADGFVALGKMGAVGTNRIVIGADDGFIGTEPYVAGPNAGNTSLLKNIAPDLGYSDPQNLTDVNGTLFFSAFSETTGRELWKVTDPALGAQLVADIMPGAADSFPGNLTVFNGVLVFSANSPNGRQLYVTDGSAGGTHPLKNLGPGIVLFHESCLDVVGDRLYFFADGSDGNGPGVWISDGTDAGTQDIHPAGITNGYCLSNEPGFAAAGNKVLFQGFDSTHGYELFRTDGTLAGTALVRDIAPGSAKTGDSSTPSNFVSIGALACFSVGQGGGDGLADAEPWCSDGTAQGTLPLGDLNPGTDSSLPMGFTRVGADIVFSAFAPALGRRVWRSDGSAANTIAFGSGGVNNIVRDSQTEGPAGGALDAPPFEHDGSLVYFPCTFALSGPGLCTQNVEPGQESTAAFYQFATLAIDQLRVFPGGDALMSCDTVAAGRELCRFRAGPGDTQAALVDIAAGGASSSPDQFTLSGTYIYFTADDGVHGRELWAVAVKDTLDRIFHDPFE